MEAVREKHLAAVILSPLGVFLQRDLKPEARRPAISLL
jgi:hypothetical protein